MRLADVEQTDLVAVDETDRIGSLCLPLICREVLEDELIARSIDIEPRFWPPGDD